MRPFQGDFGFDNMKWSQGSNHVSISTLVFVFGAKKESQFIESSI
jgi:hypothetical protein